MTKDTRTTGSSLGDSPLKRKDGYPTARTRCGNALVRMRMIKTSGAIVPQRSRKWGHKKQCLFLYLSPACPLSLFLL